MTHFFSRIRLTKAGADHRMRTISDEAYDIHEQMWDLFPGMPDEKRTFLYSVMDDGRTIYMVSEKEPIMNNYWEVESKPYDPQINTGDVFKFRTRVNPVITKTIDGKHQRHDVVMNYKRSVKGSGMDMNNIIHASVLEWINRKGSLNGFEVDEKSVLIHSYMRNETKKRNKKIVFSTVIVEGTLQVSDANLFKNVLFKGIGAAKGFGCGLMMIKRS